MLPNKPIDLTEGNLLRNLIKLSIPIVLSNLLQMIYNVVDIFWLGKLGENAKGAVSVAGMSFPIVFFFLAIGIGLTTAGTALISQYKGSGQPEKLRHVVGQFTNILVIFFLIIILVNYKFSKNILRLLNTPSSIFTDANSYFSIILYAMPFMIIFKAFQSFARGLGDTITPLKIQAVAIGINVVLDPLLIFGVGFFPKLGVTGAAIATFSARAIAGIFSIIMVLRKFKILMPRLENIKPDFSMLKKILNISLPASLGMSMTSLGFIILQGFVNTFGTLVISAFSIGKRLMSIFMIPSMGFSKALEAIVGQNLGAKNVKRAEESLWLTLKVVAVIMLVGGSIIFFFGGQLTQIFIKDQQVFILGQRMTKVIAVAAFVFSMVFVIFGVFNGSGHTKFVMFFNIARLWLFRLPFVFILSGEVLALDIFRTGIFKTIFTTLAKPLAEHPYDAVWWAMLFSNILVFIISFISFKSGKWKKAKIYD